jgi:hypothetical protein
VSRLVPAIDAAIKMQSSKSRAGNFKVGAAVSRGVL